MHEALITPIKIWRTFILQKKWTYLFGFVAVGVACFCQVLVQKQIGVVIDLITTHRGAEFFIKPLVIKLSLLLITLCLARIGWRALLARQSHYAGHDLRLSIFDSIRFFSKDRLDSDYSVGHVMNISTSDVGFARMIFGFTIVGFSDVIFLGLFSMVMIALINVKMLIAVVIALSLHPFMIKILAKKELDAYATAQEELSVFNDQISQSVGTIRLQRLSHTFTILSQRLKQYAETYRLKSLRARNLSLMYDPLMSLGELFSYIVLFSLGIYEVLNHRMSIGEFVAIQSYVLLLQGPIVNLGAAISEWQKGMACFDRITELLNEPKDSAFQNKNHELIDETKIPLEIKSLSFSFPNSEKVFFNSLSLTMRRGEHIGIKGPVGSGKTLLTRILIGLERKFQGEILFYGRSFNEYQHETIRNVISIVPQKTFLFADTIKNNVAPNLSLSDEEVYYYLDLAGVKEDVLAFNDGLLAELGEEGINLSGGQKQRLSLARALTKKPKILVLDDALSAVDTLTEERIMNGLKKELVDTTVIWISHRESTLSLCSQVVEL